MTKQIETPLSIILNNYDFIKKDMGKDLLKYDEQINSSIRMLENSYEDLTYIVNNDKVDYPLSKINLSEFLEKRIAFFSVIAKSKNSFISSKISKNITVFINETELERLIDNNLSNGIKYGNAKDGIFVSLSKENDEISLKFYSSSCEIKNKEKIFFRNYQENITFNKSLGLGLSMVKSICDKYKIKYEVLYEENKNVFIYRFK